MPQHDYNYCAQSHASEDEVRRATCEELAGRCSAKLIAEAADSAAAAHRAMHHSPAASSKSPTKHCSDMSQAHLHSQTQPRRGLFKADTPSIFELFHEIQDKHRDKQRLQSSSLAAAMQGSPGRLPLDLHQTTTSGYRGSDYTASNIGYNERIHNSRRTALASPNSKAASPKSKAGTVPGSRQPWPQGSPSEAAGCVTPYCSQSAIPVLQHCHNQERGAAALGASPSGEPAKRSNSWRLQEERERARHAEGQLEQLTASLAAEKETCSALLEERAALTRLQAELLERCSLLELQAHMYSNADQPAEDVEDLSEDDSASE